MGRAVWGIYGRVDMQEEASAGLLPIEHGSPFDVDYGSKAKPVT
jgi:hypothetical protein